ncbi:transcriptional regulatory protein sir2b, putative [Plasmodium ovale]|nr:transcriptional regulatory protein sir2b, putative [Plasmodium ovale]
MNYAARLSKNENKGPLGEKEYFEDKEEEKRKIKELIEKIKTSEYIVVHSGAGISTSSGLQDFRGPTGIWTNEFLNEMKNKKKRKSEREKEKDQVKTKKIGRHLLCKFEHSDGSSKHCSVNKTGEIPCSYIKKERDISDEGDKIEGENCEIGSVSPQTYQNYKKLNNRYYSTITNFELGSLQNRFVCASEDYPLRSAMYDTCELTRKNSPLSYNDDNDTKTKPKMDIRYTDCSQKEKRRQHMEEKNIHVKKENWTNNFRKTYLDEEDKNSSINNLYNYDETENGENDTKLEENYVIFGNRKKKVIDLHLALPSKTHIMIKELMNRNIIKFLITQNIDSLHYRCGTNFSKISEIHGNIFIERCDFCGRRYLRDFVISTISFKPTGSLCFLCSFPPVGICTDVLLDWNNAYEDFFHLNSIKHSQRADFHFCLGSSFYIVPASYYPSKKKFANENSYSCLINYQKSSLSKEVNLSLHSNVNNISDIIIKEFSLEPLSIRSALIIVVRCQLLDLDLHFDGLITVNKVNENSQYDKLQIDETENTILYKGGACPDEGSKFRDLPMGGVHIKGQHFSQNDGGVAHEDTASRVGNTQRAETKKYHVTDKNDTRGNGPTQSDTSKEQFFLIKCSMIKNVRTSNSDDLHKVSTMEMDRNRGLWLVKTNFSCLLEIELWYNSFVLLKLNYNENCSFIELNAWKVNVAYTYGDDIDDVDYYNSKSGNIRNFNLLENKYVSRINVDGCFHGEEPSTEAQVRNGDNGSQTLMSSHHIGSSDSRVASIAGNDRRIRTRDEGDVAHIVCDSHKSYRETNFEQFQICEILNEHVHVGYNPSNFQAQSKVELLAILSNCIDVHNDTSYSPIELSNSFKLLYNLFCIISKSYREKIPHAQRRGVYSEDVTSSDHADDVKDAGCNGDKVELFIKNLNISKNINFYSTHFLSSFVHKEKLVSQSPYTFRERKKKKKNDFILCSSSDEDKEKRIFIFYDLYMNENKDIYRIKVNKEFIKKELFNSSQRNAYSGEFKVINREQYTTPKWQVHIWKKTKANVPKEVVNTGKNNKSIMQKSQEPGFPTNEHTYERLNSDKSSNGSNISGYLASDDHLIDDKGTNGNDSKSSFFLNSVKNTSNSSNSRKTGNCDVEENVHSQHKSDENCPILKKCTLDNKIGAESCRRGDSGDSGDSERYGGCANRVDENGKCPQNNVGEKDFGYCYDSHLLFCPIFLISNKHNVGELVSRIPKYIKPQKMYTPYKKLARDKKYSNTLQKYRSEIWQEKYFELINHVDNEHIIDSTMYGEICYFPLWLLNYVNDFFECL